MKKLLILLALGLSQFMFAQQQVAIIDLYVLDASGNPEPNYPLLVTDFSSGSSTSITIITDANGRALDTMAIGTVGLLYSNISTAVCFDSVTMNYTPNTSNIYFTDTLYTCSTSGTNCNYNVSGLPVAGISNQAYFTYSGNNGLTYLWDFGDGNTSTQPSPFHTYAQAGTYVYCLQIDSCQPVCDTITVFNSGGCDPFFLPVTNGNTVDIFPALVTGQFQLVIDWGDGIQDTFTPQNIPIIPNTISHTYTSQGTFSICLTHSNANLGCSNTSCNSVTIATQTTQCQAAFIIDTVNSQPGNITVWNTSTPAYSPNSITQYSWDFGDGSTSTQAFPSHTYSSAGTYVICLGINVPASGSIPACSSMYCDTLKVDSLGNIIQKSTGASFTLNVLDPNTISIDESDFSTSRIFPNPASDFIQIEIDANSTGNLNIELISLNGSLINSISNDVNSGLTTLEMDVRDVVSGIYFIKISKDGTNHFEKVIIR